MSADTPSSDNGSPRQQQTQPQRTPDADAPQLLAPVKQNELDAAKAGGGAAASQQVTLPVNPAEHVGFECHLKPGPDELTVEYSFTNRHPQLDFYLFDLFPVMDLQTKQWSIDPSGAYICVRTAPNKKGSEAFILKGIPPLPPDRTLVVRYIPLTTKVGPGQTVSKSVTFKLPVREEYGYHPPLPADQYEKVKINSICFGLHWIASDAEGFEVVPDPGLPDHPKVSAKRLLQQVRLLESRTAVEGSILRRLDRFARMEIQPPAPPQAPQTAPATAPVR